MEEVTQSEPNTAFNPITVSRTVLILALAYVAISAGVMFALYEKLSTLEQRQAVVEDKAQKQAADLELRLRGTSEALAAQVGMTEKELAARSAQLRKEQALAESRLTAHQREQLQQVNTEVSGVKTDVASTKSDLEAMHAKLERAIGDLGLQSGLIARTRDELEVLKHRGDRNYYEFTLLKGKKPTPVSTVSLQLRKTDAKKSKFTLNVIADDKTIEKKDRNALEPLQFYTGRERLLYELVVNDVSKDKISGYLATPKGVPEPVVQ